MTKMSLSDTTCPYCGGGMKATEHVSGGPPKEIVSLGTLVVEHHCPNCRLTPQVTYFFPNFKPESHLETTGV